MSIGTAKSNSIFISNGITTLDIHSISLVYPYSYTIVTYSKTNNCENLKFIPDVYFINFYTWWTFHNISTIFKLYIDIGDFQYFSFLFNKSQ